MQVGATVIRKADIKHAISAYGIIEGVIGNRATVRWLKNNGHQQHSTLTLTSLAEVTEEMEHTIAAKEQERKAERKRQWEADHPYICNNVNPMARVSNQGHRKPMPLAKEQVVDGKCWYCGTPVVLREEVQGE